jgi:ATP synthase protein I
VADNDGSTEKASGGTEQTGGKRNGVIGDVVKVESMIQLAIALPAACFIGWLIGAEIDKHFHTSWVGLVGILVGAIAGFVQIFATASKILNRDSGK